jgi:BMFP domain-containing protein YqiC
MIGDFNMLKPRFVEDLNARMSEILASSPARDLEKNLQVMLSGVFTRLNLVTREEFDVQAKVLMRTREKLAVIEKKMVELEQQAQK